jgi:hypothetical protein
VPQFCAFICQRRLQKELMTMLKDPPAGMTVVTEHFEGSNNGLVSGGGNSSSSQLVEGGSSSNNSSLTE